MSDRPLAYHITFGTYGTRLHGDPRGTVDKTHNKPGDPIVGQNDDWFQIESSSLNDQPVMLDHADRIRIECAIEDVCDKGNWHLHIAACQSNHVHVLLTSIDDGILTRRLLKRWLTELLEDTAEMNLKNPVRWWAKEGSVKWVWDQRYLENVYWYIAEQRTTPTEPRRPRRGPP